ncbi:hypothetical protein ACFLU6_02110 [Acidobacteriota bacterium]
MQSNVISEIIMNILRNKFQDASDKELETLARRLQNQCFSESDVHKGRNVDTDSWLPFLEFENTTKGA